MPIVSPPQTQRGPRDDSDLVTALTASLTAPGEPFETEAATVFGQQMTVWSKAPQTLRDVLSASLEWGGRPLLQLDDERLSFAEHACAAASLGRWLAARGVRPGDRVAVAASNSPRWSVAFWGAVACGAVVVPLNAWWTGDELAYAIADSGTSVLLADATRGARVAGTLPETIMVIGLEAGVAGAVALLSEIADAGAPFVMPRVDPPVDGGAVTDTDTTIFYTSGTTGRAKGAVGTHRNITSNLMNLLFWGALAQARALALGEPQSDEPEQHSALVTVPLFHATGCHATLVVALAQGWRLVLLRRFDPGTALDLVERERITRLVGVPTTVLEVLEASSGRDLSSLTYIGYGGAPAAPELLRRLRLALPHCAVGVGYGLTESSANATTNIGTDYLDHPDSVGRPCPVIHVIATAAGKELPAGETGELAIRGPVVVRGYWGRPEETSAAFRHGWLLTGDIGRVDADGRVYISDRAKDVIIRGGENVYCAEVEAELARHPDVVEAALVGVEHPRLGEEVGAVLRLRPGCGWDDAAALQVQDQLRQRLAGFKTPSRIRVQWEPLPRTATGKLIKTTLRTGWTP